MLDTVKHGQAEALVVYKLDRLTRSIGDLLELMNPLSKQDVALVSTQESLDATTATGRLMMNLLALLGQWEREVIGERTREAMSYLKKQRKVYSRPVYGYDSRKGKLYVNRHEQAVIRMAQEWSGRGSSYRQIAADLNIAGVAMKGGPVESNDGSEGVEPCSSVTKGSLVYRVEKERRVRTTNLLFCYGKTGRKQDALLQRMRKGIESF